MTEIQKHVRELKEELGRAIVGQEEPIEQLLIALLTHSHALLEGYPGLAKTLMVRALAETLDLRFSRIQGTPDLLPSDITGTYIIDESKGKREFKFQPGPVFANIVLMDEINRAAPKTQSALLEAMQEHQVTMGNSTFPLEEPFFVLATQNPIEQEGSLPLDQHVFINDELKNGTELLQSARAANLPSIQKGKFTLYNIPDAFTKSLTAAGRLEKQPCSFYTYPCEDEVINLTTRIGREITVTKNHPFLVNDHGVITWKKAEELVEGDYLVSPSRLPEEQSQVEIMSHSDTLQHLSQTYTILFAEELLRLKHLSENFTVFHHFTGRDFDSLRIASTLQIKQLATNIGCTTARTYWQLVRFLRRPTQNTEIHTALATYFAHHPPLFEHTDFIDSLKPIAIKRFSVDHDIAFFLAFLLSDGGTVGSVYAVQKNYPRALDRFVRILNEKIGTGIDSLSIDKTQCRSAHKRSQPFVHYLCLRFGLSNKKHKTAGLPSWILNLPPALRKEFLQTFISLEGNIRDHRIKLSQANKQSINILSYMLLKEGILSWFATKKRSEGGNDYVLKIQGEDFSKYLTNIGWIETEITQDWLRKARPGTFSPFRVLPSPREKILRIVDLLGINSFHTYKKRTSFIKRDWYCGYKAMQQGRENISVDMFNLLLRGLEKEIHHREAISRATSDPKQIRHLAVLSGFSLNEVAGKAGCSNDTVWSYYQGKTLRNATTTVQIQECIKETFTLRLAEAKSILTYLQKLVTPDILYDRIEKLTYTPYQGLVFGLTVPKLHNYLAGYGACGINHNTFILPEAQRDRFIFKINVAYPQYAEEEKILARYAESTRNIRLHKVLSKETLLALQDLTRQVPIANDIKRYALDLIVATRQNKKLIEYGASPRASINLLLASKARALINGRKYVSKDDIKAMVFPILRHRIIISFEAERQGMDEDAVIKDLLKK